MSFSVLMPWKVSSVIRRPLLLIGEEKAGKTAWCCAIAKQCAAAHICISAKNLAIKGAKKLRHAIEQVIFSRSLLSLSVRTSPKVPLSFS